MWQLPQLARPHHVPEALWDPWHDGVARELSELCQEWELTPDGELTTRFGGELELPVRLAVTGGRAVPATLSIAVPTPANEHEALVLQHWGGHGGVRLLRANPRRRALLLERLGVEDLGQEWDVQACETIGGLYRTLHQRAPAQLGLLSTYAEQVVDRLGRLPRGVPLPPRMVDQARSLSRDFVRDPDTDGLTIHTDLHYGRVRRRGEVADQGAGSSAQWGVTGPLPMSGDPHFELTPLLYHRFGELEGRVRSGLRDRFFAALDAGELDEERAKQWVLVRLVDLAGQRILGELQHRQLEIPDREWITQVITIIKALDG